MNAIFALPLPLRMVVVGLLGTMLGAVVNWATYRLAWNNRDISPWGPKSKKAPPRQATDRIPVLGWLGLRRETNVHGAGFWIRPLLIEVLMGLGLAALYWWEVDRQALIANQFDVPPLPLASDWLTHGMFLCHVVLIGLMAAASFVDLDEKMIPSLITDVGSLLGLVLMTLLPTAFLPHVSVLQAAPPIGEELNLLEVEQGKFYVEPTTLTAPNSWPPQLNGWQAMCLGLACWWLWCFALTPRIWRGRHGAARAIYLIYRRVVRELTRPLNASILLAGTVAIPAVWWLGGNSWIGLLTALVGMVVSGSVVWVVRIVGSAVLQREAMGFGDVTLMMMVGTFLGWQSGLMIFFVAPFFALSWGVMRFVLKRDDEIPYGPFLCLGALTLIIWWPRFWSFPVQDYFAVGWLIPAVLVVGFLMLGVMLFIWQMIKIALFYRDDDDADEGETK